MKPSLQRYLETKDDICLVAMTPVAALQLLLLRLNLQAEFPGARFHVATDPPIPGTISLRDLKSDYGRFGAVYELRGDRAVLDFFETNGVPLACPASGSSGTRLVTPDAAFLPAVAGLARERGLKVSVGDEMEGAACYADGETPDLYRAAIDGIPLILINPTETCRKMFPGYPVIQI